MDQQDKIYLWLVLVTTAAFTTAIVFAVMRINEYKNVIVAPL